MSSPEFQTLSKLHNGIIHWTVAHPASYPMSTAVNLAGVVTVQVSARLLLPLLLFIDV
jgi:hypothetical protein